jgi:glyoxylase-like metal-dependent hydrolase (beta-lactamase superfamily II)
MAPKEARESWEAEMYDLRILTLGEFQTNCYLLVAPELNRGILIDPADKAEKILEWIQPLTVGRILLTHGHPDHVGALEQVRQTLAVPVGLHPADAQHFDLAFDFELQDGDQIDLGDHHLIVSHVPGHTPGSVAFRLFDEGENPRAIVGDAVFPGGPGHTRSPAALRTSLESLSRTVFTWEDATILYPGHGTSTTVGAERSGFDSLRSRPLPADMFGDVAWG